MYILYVYVPITVASSTYITVAIVYAYSILTRAHEMHACMVHSQWRVSSLETCRETFRNMETFKLGDYVQYKKAKNAYDEGHVHPITKNRTLPPKYQEWNQGRYEGCGFMRVVQKDFERRTIGVIVPCLVLPRYRNNKVVGDDLRMDRVMRYKVSELVHADDEPEESEYEFDETEERKDDSDGTLGRVLKNCIRKPRYFAVFGLPRRVSTSVYRTIRGFYVATCNAATFFLTSAFNFFPRVRDGQLQMHFLVGFETLSALRMFREEFALRKKYLLAYHEVKPVTSDNARVGMKVMPGVSWHANVVHLGPWHSSAERFDVRGFIEGTIQDVYINPDSDCMVLVEWSDGTSFWYRAGVSVKLHGGLKYFMDLFESVGENPAVEEFDREKRIRTPCGSQPRKKTCHLQQRPYANAAGLSRPYEFPRGHRGPEVSQSSSSNVKVRSARKE
jgi:hypothetical protein